MSKVDKSLKAAVSLLEHRENVDKLLNHLEEQFKDLVRGKEEPDPGMIGEYLTAIRALREERQHLRT